jgi:hypothetical protein
VFVCVCACVRACVCQCVSVSVWGGRGGVMCVVIEARRPASVVGQCVCLGEIGLSVRVCLHAHCHQNGARQKEGKFWFDGA